MEYPEVSNGDENQVKGESQKHCRSRSKKLESGTIPALRWPLLERPAFSKVCPLLGAKLQDTLPRGVRVDYENAVGSASVVPWLADLKIGTICEASDLADSLVLKYRHMFCPLFDGR